MTKLINFVFTTAIFSIMFTYHIHITGLVQGVGFRPFIYRLAKELHLNGEVYNGSDGLHIRFNGNIDDAVAFEFKIRKEAPIMSHITSLVCSKVEDQTYDDFQIVHSFDSGEKQVWLSPDFGICQNCIDELNDVTNRRYYYPFITCTTCGPRLSIIEQLPYDRHYTTMTKFVMCEACFNEYQNPSDRRFYSQTNSCTQCGVSVQMNEESYATNSQVINDVVTWINSGKIVALKGTGGFLLLCDATNEESIIELRKKKNRPAKPFAVLYLDLKMIQADAFVDDTSASLLGNIVKPIVLLQTKKHPESNICVDLIAPGLKKIGAMLPNNGLLYLVSKAMNKPLIATSANISGSPIIYKDVDARNMLFSIADFVVGNDRPITMPQDDSVITLSPFFKKVTILRRSRGMAPGFMLSRQHSLPSMLALGADLKSSFAMSFKHNIYVSQYLGNLSSYDAQTTYQQTLQKYLKITGSKPDFVLTDKHPSYYSNQLYKISSEQQVFPIQHHKAHFAAVLLENDLFHCQDHIMGVIWDGIGYGDDDQIWGGEFFIYHNQNIERHAHIGYFDYLLGDKMSNEPRLSALSLCINDKQAHGYLKNKFNNNEFSLYCRMLEKGNQKLTSSVGRLFDGVASILGLKDFNSFEGEAAMLLEQSALSWFLENGIDFDDYYEIPMISGLEISISGIIGSLLEDLTSGKEIPEIAAKFHLTLVKIIEKISIENQCEKIAFSGGTFQNGLLKDLILHHLGHKYTLYFHRQLSPNDENLSLGQLAYHYNINIKNESKK